MAVALVIGLAALLVNRLVTSGGESGAASPLIEEAAVLRGFPGEVQEVSFSADGRTLLTVAAGESNAAVQLWDVSKRQAVFTGPGGFVHSVDTAVVSPDGKFLALATDSTPRLIDVTSGQVIKVLGRHQGTVTMVFSPDSRVLATAGACACNEDFDNPVKIWDSATGDDLATLTGPGNGVQSMEFNADGTTLAAGAVGKKPAVHLWKAGPWTNLQTFAGAGYLVKFSPDGKTLATGGDGRPGQLWNVSSGAVTATIGEVTPLAFSPDGRTLVTGTFHSGGERDVQQWDVTSGQQGPLLDDAYPVAFRPQSTVIAVTGNQRDMRLVDVASRDVLATSSGYSVQVNDLAFSPDGRTLATAGADGTVRLWAVGL